MVVAVESCIRCQCLAVWQFLAHLILFCFSAGKQAVDATATWATYYSPQVQGQAPAPAVPAVQQYSYQPALTQQTSPYISRAPITPQPSMYHTSSIHHVALSLLCLKFTFLSGSCSCLVFDTFVIKLLNVWPIVQLRPWHLCAHLL